MHGIARYSTLITQVAGKSPQQCALAARGEQSPLVRGAGLEGGAGGLWGGEGGEGRGTMFDAVSGREFIPVSSESRPGLPPDEAARALFARFSTELQAHGLSLDDPVRTRLWGRDRAARDGGSGARVRVLFGKARSASSSYISPRHFESAGAVAVDLWDMWSAARNDVKYH